MTRKMDGGHQRDTQNPLNPSDSAKTPPLEVEPRPPFLRYPMNFVNVRFVSCRRYERNNYRNLTALSPLSPSGWGTVNVT